MTDITSINLNAAILDQKIAGLFRNKPYAFVAVLVENLPFPWGIGIAVENERGYNPVDSKLFNWDSHSAAEDFVDAMNRHIGLSRREALDLVVTTMGRMR